MSRARLGPMAALAALFSCALLASATAGIRDPLPSGAYCGPDGAAIRLDGTNDTVDIAGYTCAFPVFAADKLQSIQCRRGGVGAPERKDFDLRVLGDAFLYDGRWFRPCKGP